MGFSFVPPKAGGMAFVGYNMDINSTEFVHKLRVDRIDRSGVATAWMDISGDWCKPRLSK